MIKGTVTDIFTEGFVEVAVWGEDGKRGRTRSVAQASEKIKRGDVVELEPAKAWHERLSRYLYLSVPAMFAIGFVFDHEGDIGERVLSGLILAFMAFLISWICNRKSRLRRRLEYSVVRIIEREYDPLDINEKAPAPENEVPAVVLKSRRH